MVFLEFLEWVVSALVVVFFVFQIIVPLWKGIPLFPAFRLKRIILLDQLKEAREELELDEMASEVEKERIKKEKEREKRKEGGETVKDFQ